MAIICEKNLKTHKCNLYFTDVKDLRNIWVHTLSIAKEGLDDILKVLKSLIQKYLDNDIYVHIEECVWKYLLYDGIWTENHFKFCQTIGTEEIEYNKSFFFN
ncbi:Plasmodium exported protein, unknown function [Plasmodium reichenowi]|uniref:Plasmodium RESA N-terminal domain-containing protein n=1 Tax=Plasmodium reichenowi TaxID=5854 RepID=A0A060RYY7_PLARE|nr:Plasmodium exported protein, unknown function [Plasmodium reichenowi]